MQLLHRLHALVDVFFFEIDVELLAHLPKLFVLGTHLPDDLRRIAGDNHARGNYLLHFYDRAFGNNSPLPDLRPDAEDGAHADNCPIADTFSMKNSAVPDITIITDNYISDNSCRFAYIGIFPHRRSFTVKFIKHDYTFLKMPNFLKPCTNDKTVRQPLAKFLIRLRRLTTCSQPACQ